MFNLTSPTKAGFTRLRGRPKKPKYDGGTNELQKKRRQLRHTLNNNPAGLIYSWLHMAYHDGTISQRLFDLGSQYLRLRSMVLHGMETRTFRLSCHTFIKGATRPSFPGIEKRNEKAEELWYQLLTVLPICIVHTLDDLLFKEVNYDLSAELINHNKKRLKDCLIHLNRYVDYL